MTRTPDGPPQGPARKGFIAEVKDAVSLRAALLVFGVLALQLAFITSYVGAFHEPKLHQVPLAVVAPSQQVAGEAARRLAVLPGDPVDPRVVADETTARREIENRDIDGALLVDPRGTTDVLLVASASGASLSQAIIETVTAAEADQRRSVRIVDVVPDSPGDSRSLTSFYLVIGWCVGGYLCAAILAISVGARPANTHRALIRLGVLLLYSIAAGLLGTVIAGPILDALPGSVPALWGLGTLLVFTVGAITLAFQGLAGVIGIGLAILLVVVLGNPSAGGAYPYPLLPPFWRSIGPALPPGAGTFAARSITYFRGNAMTGPMLVLSAWAVGASLLTVASALRRHSPSTKGAETADRSGPPSAGRTDP
ncbi:DUF3533 domain-containing protein [Streptomyces albipurpureus]|uniref:DUF3533 domain-containing protein n=1 Tax=Streptomyces albipurpureus TaxID=2897419 RepID=A0ABT0UPV6_9ACTN|nr:DUF3533 domain-containing protein [Streptomyces sp. CWNU-1]MCM2390276.1 DUF3533 domain-containing protein [Streptomyces sp. CWNU-1]